MGFDTLLTYADRDWSPDHLKTVYHKSGFTYLGDSGPILRYINLSKSKHTIHSRQQFQKHKLKDMFPDIYDEKLTANQILSMKHIHPIYNSGNHKFVLNF